MTQPVRDWWSRRLLRAAGRARHNDFDYACVHWRGDRNPEPADLRNIALTGEPQLVAERRCLVCRPFTDAESDALLDPDALLPAVRSGKAAAHLADMTKNQDQQTDPQADARFNTRQWRIVNFAVRKNARWARAEFDSTVAVITKPNSDRQMVLYPSGRTLQGVRVAIIDPNVRNGSPQFISQKHAWFMLAEAIL